MLYTEQLNVENRAFTRTYSDKFYIEREGAEYIEAYDPAEFGRVYTETEHELEESNNEATAADYEAALADLGVKLNDES